MKIVLHKLVFPLLLMLSFSGLNKYLIGKSTADSKVIEMQYHITELSTLEVNGKTNVNSFCCTSTENYKKKSLRYQEDTKNASLRFDNAVLSLKTAMLDCGKKAINKDMHKTLQADTYPEIILELKEVKNTKCNDIRNCDEWYEVTAVADITITCYTNTYIFPVSIKELDNHYFRVSGHTTLQLCDYEIDPPTALLGLIKVKDGLDIGFDLYIEIG